jgi:hypothetical protein
MTRPTVCGQNTRKLVNDDRRDLQRSGNITSMLPSCSSKHGKVVTCYPGLEHIRPGDLDNIPIS